MLIVKIQKIDDGYIVEYVDIADSFRRRFAKDLSEVLSILEHEIPSLA